MGAVSRAGNLQSAIDNNQFQIGKRIEAAMVLGPAVTFCIGKQH
jgi:hypothetical protein